MAVVVRIAPSALKYLVRLADYGIHYARKWTIEFISAQKWTMEFIYPKNK